MGNKTSTIEQNDASICQQCGTTNIQFISNKRVYINSFQPLTAFAILEYGNGCYYLSEDYLCINGHKINCIHL